MEEKNPLLRMEGITKSFPGVLANDQVTIDLNSSEILSLVGENGSGKSTLMKVLLGIYRSDGGTIFIEGKQASISKVRDSIALGVGMVHQHFMLASPFTVLENIIFGQEKHRLGMLDLEGPRKEIEALMRESDLWVDLNLRVEDLPLGQRQRVEILRLLYHRAKILILDEPTAVLTPQETVGLFATLRRLKAAGRGVIFISHKLDEVLEISDRITVVRRGRVIKTFTPEGVTKRQIADLMVGKPVLLDIQKPPLKNGPVVLDVQNLCHTNWQGERVIKNLSFSVRAGEIYGLAGIEGNGQSELVSLLSGEMKVRHEGKILLKGQPITRQHVSERRKGGISYIPEDRRERGLLLPLTVADNTVLGRCNRRPFVRWRWYRNKKAIVAHARSLVKEFDIRPPSEEVPVESLSGGNQQKVIIAREMADRPSLLLASQPTRGVDVGSTEFIYRKLVEFRSQGGAIFMVSADLDEILLLSDRVGVIFKGKIVGEFSGQEIEKGAIGHLMVGGEGGHQ